MGRIVAYCGLLCDECEAYQATQAKDGAALEQVAASWREKYQNPGIIGERIWCDGCLGDQGLRCFHCAECATRACGLEHGINNCGECMEYESCDRIQSFFKYVPSARIVLDEIHAGLGD